MTNNEDHIFSLDLGQRTYAIGRNPPVVIPDALSVSFYTAREELIDDRTGQIRFFADGSATGGGIRLVSKGQRHDIHINWLTGRVWVDQP